MASSPVGRDEAIDAAWHSLTTGVPVVVEGPAGIGKTVVWQALVDRAADAGRLVLTCAPTETETALPFAALDDVLRPLAGSLAQLPVPQRAAVEGVLLTGTPQQAVDERAVGAATRALLASVEGPVLLAVDDAPWLDPASERALRFALRRLPSDGPPVAVLVTRRIDDGPDPGLPLGLDDAPGRAAVRVPLGPLGVGALHHVVRARLGASLSRPLLARIAAEAHGNPLLAVEMARAVLRLPQPPRAGEDLPVPSSIRQLLGDTLATLPPATRDAVRLAALLAVPTPADLASAGVPSPALDAAEEAGLLAVTDRRVAFGHPLYASAVRAAIPPGVRR
ncbi:MAG TPA: AAA family ATPase, partial [Kineosporiaceae bacterium]|nr:AAA family ATPase [Kineosporiaceae bacterium]